MYNRVKNKHSTTQTSSSFDFTKAASNHLSQILPPVNSVWKCKMTLAPAQSSVTEDWTWNVKICLDLRTASFQFLG